MFFIRFYSLSGLFIIICFIIASQREVSGNVTDFSILLNTAGTQHPESFLSRNLSKTLCLIWVDYSQLSVISIHVVNIKK